MLENPDIRLSWYRSTLAGLTASDTIEGRTRAVNLESRLAKAATPALDALALRLGESNLGTLLADRHGVLVQRRFGTRTLANTSDKLGVVVGAQFTEQTTGTNAIATPIETRRGIFIEPEQHFLECLRTQACIGLPIIQLGTRRLEGVITLMAPSGVSLTPMKAALASTVEEIQQRLLSTYSDGRVAFLHSFRAVCSSHRHIPVIALEPNGIYINDLAAELDLVRADFTVLRELAAGRDVHSNDVVVVDLSIGQQVVAVDRVSEHGTVFRLRCDKGIGDVIPRSSVRHRTAGNELADALDLARHGNGHVLIRGEPGSGRTTTATELAGGDHIPIIDGRDVVAKGAHDWVATLLHTQQHPLGALIVESVNLMDTKILEVLYEAMQQTRFRMILTSDIDVKAIASVAALCRFNIEVPALRQRRSEFAEILNQLLVTRGAANLHFTASAMEVLAAQDWPGNLTELRLLVDEVQALRSIGDITVADLPRRYRTPAHRRELSLLEQAEFDTIRKVLNQVRGNKAQAAKLLGISRPTLYSRIRALGLTPSS